MMEFVLFLFPILQSAALVIARPLGFLIVFPLFQWIGLQGMVRNAVALAIGLPFAQIVYTGIAGEGGVPLDPQLIVVLSIKEFAIGALLGVLLGVPFWAAEMAGSYVDVYRGTSSATVVSPSMTAQPLVTGALFSMTLVAIFIALGGLRTAIGIVYQSYEIWPYFETFPSLTQNFYPVLMDVLAQVAKVALALGAPILIAMFLGDIALAYTSRFAPQINVFDTSLAVKNLIYLLILPPYMLLLTRYYGADLLGYETVTEILRGLAGQ